MDKQQHGISLNGANWKGRYGRLALAVLSVVCLMESPIHTTETANSGNSFEPVLNASTKKAAADFEWYKLVAGPDLDYMSCYDGLKCAKLQLPMDHWNSSVKANISLAVIRKPAQVDVTSPRYGGAIQLNPGGPGGSGIEELSYDGYRISKIVDTQDDHSGKYFDLLSFDPRGVGNSAPEMRCPEVDDSKDKYSLTLEEQWLKSKEDGEGCSVLSPDGKEDIKRYMNTINVAKDMVSLIEAHGRWRQKEGEQLAAGNGKARHDTTSSEPWRHQPGHEKLQYWGYSYGSYLGMTFAALFPQRVERMVVDGVMDADDYTKGLEYHDLDDAEKALDEFYSSCARAGSGSCVLANRKTPTTAEDVKVKVQGVIASLKRRPLQPVIRERTEKITHGMVEKLIYDSLHEPLTKFPPLASAILDVEQERGSFFLSKYHTSIDDPSNITYMGIACTDANDQSGVSIQEFRRHLERLEEQSPSFGSIVAGELLRCIHYGIRPERFFAGQWVGNTSHPILLIGNTADPITPLRNAFKMARGYQGAVVLTQNSTGHGSWSAPSDCTDRYVRKYFQTGELPPNNTVCNPDKRPFYDA